MPNHSGPDKPARRLSDPGAFLATTAVGVALTLGAVRLAGLVRDTAVNLPFQDQWDLLRPFFAGEGWWAAFRWQHGPHRQGLGGVLNWFLYRGTDWDVRAESWLGAAVLLLAALAALALAVRLRGRLHWGDAVFPLILLSPVHWETMLLTPNLAHGILPVLLVFLLALAWTVESAGGRVLGVGVLAALCLFTGFAFCAALVSAGLVGLLLWRPAAGADRRPALLLLGAFGIALVAFGWGYRWDPAVPGWRFPVEAWWDYPRFVAYMYASLLGWRAVGPGPALLGAALLGPVLLAFGWAGRELWARRSGPAVRAVWLLTGTSLAYAAFTAVGRLPVNIEAAFMWRYLPLLTPALAGVVIWGATIRPAWRPGCAALGLAVGAVVWGNFTPERHAATIAKAKLRWIEAYRATGDLAAANRLSDFYVYRGDPESALIAERLRWLEQHRLSFFR